MQAMMHIKLGALSVSKESTKVKQWYINGQNKYNFSLAKYFLPVHVCKQ